eukprot:s2620_g2.t1
MPAPKRASSPGTAKASVPAAVPGPVEASLPCWRPLLSQLSDELERLEDESRKLRELLGVPSAPRRHHDEVPVAKEGLEFPEEMTATARMVMPSIEIRGPPAQVVLPPAIPENSRKLTADDSWSLALRSKGLLPGGYWDLGV